MSPLDRGLGDNSFMVTNPGALPISQALTMGDIFAVGSGQQSPLMNVVNNPTPDVTTYPPEISTLITDNPGYVPASILAANGDMFGLGAFSAATMSYVVGIGALILIVLLGSKK